LSRPLWLVKFLKAVYPARFLVAQSTRLPIVGKAIGRFFFADDNMIYLPRDSVVPSSSNGSSRGRVIEVQHPLDATEDLVLPSQVVDHFIDQASDLWIMHECICRRSMECTDYPIDLGCLFMGQAVREINPALGRRVTREEAKAHVRRCRGAGLVHVIGRNKLDSMWLGAGPGRQLLTVCNCCPCCCLFSVLPHLDEHLQTKITRAPGIQVSVTDRCVGCGVCTHDVCFMDAIHLDTVSGDGRAQIDEVCVGCGRCVEICPQQAIVVSGTDGPFVEQAIAHISPSVDVT